jgi:hypothetical protein
MQGYSAVGDAVWKHRRTFLSKGLVQDCLSLSFRHVLQREIVHMRSHNLLRVTTRANLARVKTQAYSNPLVLPTQLIFLNQTLHSFIVSL